MATPGEREPLNREALTGIESTSVRHGFVQKVYGILGVQLLVTTAIGGAVMKYADTMVRTNPSLSMGLLVLSSVVTLAMMFVFICCPNTMRNSPTNYILLMLFTIAEAVLVGFISAQYTKESMLMVLAVTVLVVLGLSLFACQTKYDITSLWPYVFAASLVMCGFGLVLWIASLCGLAGSPAFHGLRLVYAVCGAILSSFFIVFDTQMIVGGKHTKFSFSIDDYCMAAITLYLDIIQLFLYLLELFGDRRR